MCDITKQQHIGNCTGKQSARCQEQRSLALRSHTLATRIKWRFTSLYSFLFGLFVSFAHFALKPEFTNPVYNNNMCVYCTNGKCTKYSENKNINQILARINQPTARSFSLSLSLICSMPQNLTVYLFCCYYCCCISVSSCYSLLISSSCLASAPRVLVFHPRRQTCRLISHTILHTFKKNKRKRKTRLCF